MRSASLEEEGADRALLTELGLAQGDGSLSGKGREFDDARWVYDDEPTARALWYEGLLRLPPAQALMQGLHGRGAVGFDGSHHLLARHGLAEVGNPGKTRAFLQVLNSAGIVAYSNKKQTVRVLAPVPEELAASVRVVEPTRPYTNLLVLRETLRACEKYIWWAEPHLPGKALEPLAYEADSEKIKSIRLLSGEKFMDDTTRSDFKRFAAEMAGLGITAEWRLVPQKQMDWHDRFILGGGKGQAWNVPPTNTLLKGDYSELSRTPTRPPFEKWWALGVLLAT